MDPFEPVRLVLIVTHLLGLALIIGASAAQLRRRDRYSLAPVLVGASTQLVSGAALVATRRLADLGVDETKIGVKLALAIVVLVAAIIAIVRQRRGRTARPALHIAGGTAVANVLVAVLWS